MTHWNWRKSSRSADHGDCVEVARPDGRTVGVRDSKNPHGGHVEIGAAAWSAFVGRL